MSTTRREFIRTVGGGIASSRIAFGAAEATPPAPAASTTLKPPQAPIAAPRTGKRKVIYDQDNSGPFGTDILGTLMMLQADNVDLLGVTLVTGDAWMKQEMAF